MLLPPELEAQLDKIDLNNQNLPENVRNMFKKFVIKNANVMTEYIIEVRYQTNIPEKYRDNDDEKYYEVVTKYLIPFRWGFEISILFEKEMENEDEMETLIRFLTNDKNYHKFFADSNGKQKIVEIIRIGEIPFDVSEFRMKSDTCLDNIKWIILELNKIRKELMKYQNVEEELKYLDIFEHDLNETSPILFSRENILHMKEKIPLRNLSKK